MILFYSKEEAVNFDDNIADNDNFNFFKYKTKLLGSTKVAEVNATLKKHNNFCPIKYLKKVGGHFKCYWLIWIKKSLSLNLSFKVKFKVKLLNSKFYHLEMVIIMMI